MNDNVVYVDLQGFKSNSNKFIPKEVAIIFSKNEYNSFIVKPPYDFKYLSTEKKKEAKWLTKNYHHINWTDGSVSLESVCNFLIANIKHSKVYVKGEEKKNWLEEMVHQQIFNIEEIGCINFKQMEAKNLDNIYCKYHQKLNGICALRNVFLLAKEKENI